MEVSLLAQAIGAAIALVVYFLPAILADRRKRRDVLVIALFNAVLGWTGFGWALALYWSLQPNPPVNVAGEVVEKRRNVTMRGFSKQLVERVRMRASRTATRDQSTK
ncbi:superinfection immunity protein [Paraburkholderia saeva]|uniref:superinfection immunity protein n=1 Tax=Paraburkholderia saeva TaxID=2777537 RepID=UPI001DCAF993|nr:superinfection immunity protein [Paraburkholderia saeva]CAG4889083.1 hypothetical protein R52603_00864 [Paraburkholderia saeva]